MSIGNGKTVVIAGAGLAGSLLACYLDELGFKVRVFERRSDPRKAGYVGGRSINLALSARGLYGLEGVGLKEEILRHAIPMKGRIMHKAERNPELVFQPYSKSGTDAINSISRGGLNLALIEAAGRRPGVEFVFDRRCVDVDVATCSAVFVDDATGVTERVSGDLVIGADGAFSAVRGALQKTERFEYSQTYLGHGYKELHIPAVEGGAFGGYAMDPNALHIWPRGSAMMIALPNPDKSFTCTLFWPYEGEHGLEQAGLKTREGVRAFFEKHYPDAVAMMPTLEEDFLRNPVGSLVTVRCWPWSRHNECGTVAVIGDAAHAIVPFYGQGINAGFEDVRELAECLKRQNGNIKAAIEECERIRKPNSDAIAQMALENFVEMRDKVGTKRFMWRKKFEHLLEGIAPNALRSRYELVSFTTVPYTRALAAGERFDCLLGLLVALGVGLGVLAVGALLALKLGAVWLVGASVVAAVLVGYLLGRARL